MTQENNAERAHKRQGVTQKTMQKSSELKSHLENFELIKVLRIIFNSFTGTYKGIRAKVKAA